MSYKYINKMQTKYNPSVIEYSFSYELFICGTYELCERKSPSIDDKTDQILKRVNYRFGNLLLISKKNQLIDEHECFDGGVFDINLIEFNGHKDCVSVAHSNGFVTIYAINSFKINCIKRYKTESSLLTCLTTINNEYSVVGNSDGKLILINLMNEELSELSITKFCEPIWSLFCYKLNDNFVLIVGSDDSLWRVYYLTQYNIENLKPIYLNKDSNAGITSFASNDSKNNLLSLIVGSYDELIRFYEIEFISEELRLNVILKHKLHIPESGIWRIIIREEFNNRLLVSGMYSGAHLILDGKVAQTFDNCNQSESTTHQKQLIYGLNCDSLMDNILMSSFYGKTIYYLKKEN